MKLEKEPILNRPRIGQATRRMGTTWTVCMNIPRQEEREKNDTIKLSILDMPRDF